MLFCWKSFWVNCELCYKGYLSKVGIIDYWIAITTQTQQRQFDVDCGGLSWTLVRLLSSDNVSNDILDIVKLSSWDVDILLQIRYLSELRLSSMPFILILQAGKNHLGVETGLTQHLEVQLNWNLITWYIYETLWRQWGHQSGSAIWFCSCQWG